MSIYPLTRVWDHSQQRGTALLLLLAMADRADELGVAWAGTNWLATRARLARRQTIRTIQQLENDEEIVVVRSRRLNGLNIVNHYIVSVGATPDIVTAAHERIAELLTLRGSVARDTTVADDTTGSVVEDTRGSGWDDTRVVAGMTPDPSSYPEEKEGVILNASDLWSLALAELEMEMSAATFRRHLAGTTAEWHGDEMVVSVRTGSADWLANRLNEIVDHAVAVEAGRPIAIRYEEPVR